MKRLFVLGLCVGLLSGCSTLTTNLTKIENSQPVPSEAILATSYFTPTVERPHKVVIVRDSGLLGAATALKISLDGEAVVLLDPGERAEIYLKPETYMVRITVNHFENWGADEGEGELTVSSKLPNTFRIKSVMGDGFYIQRSSAL